MERSYRESRLEALRILITIIFLIGFAIGLTWLLFLIRRMLYVV